MSAVPAVGTISATPFSLLAVVLYLLNCWYGFRTFYYCLIRVYVGVQTSIRIHIRISYPIHHRTSNIK